MDDYSDQIEQRLNGKDYQLLEIEKIARQWVAYHKGIRSASEEVLRYFDGRKDAALDILKILERNK